MESVLATGHWVKPAAAPEWGLEQAQSVASRKVTVSFEPSGQRVAHVDAAPLEPVEGHP